MIRKKRKYSTKIILMQRLLATTFVILSIFTYSTTTTFDSNNDMDSIINDQLRFESSQLSSNKKEKDHTTTTTNDNNENVLLLQMKMANHPGESIVLRGNQDHVTSSAILSTISSSSSSDLETADAVPKVNEDEVVSNSQIESIVTEQNKSDQIQFIQPLSSSSTTKTTTSKGKLLRQPKLAQANTPTSMYSTNNNNNNNIPQPKIKEFTLTEDDIKKIDSVLSDGGHRIGGLKPIWYFIALGFISFIVIVIEGVVRDDRRRRRLLEP